MNKFRTLPLPPSRDRGAGDTGFTIIELMIALAIFGIFLTVVLGSILSITAASTKVRVVSQSATAELSAFQRIDHQIRYSDSINFPGVGAPSGDPDDGESSGTEVMVASFLRNAAYRN